MLKRQLRCFALALIGLAFVGCGQAPPADPPVTPTTQADQATTLTPTPEPTPVIKTTPKGEAQVIAENAKTATLLPEAAYVGDDVVGMVVVYPKRLHDTAIYRMFRDAGLLDEFEKQVEQYKIKPESIERAVLVIDKSFAAKAAGTSGLDMSSPAEIPAATPASAVRNNLKQLGLAFHNYHDMYLAFPRAGGDAEGTKTGLSWRVQLLPLLGEGKLYEEFHLDEPWDSEHNRTLVDKMPAVFNSPGVTEAGKTALHVFIGDAAPFHGEKGLSLRAFTDGTSNTILVVAAGADTAEIWTKPGGLVFDAAAPKKALGEVGKKVQVLLADGSVQAISTTMEDAEFAKLVELADGNSVDFPRNFGSVEQGPVPIVILTFASAVDQQALIEFAVNEPEEELYEGLTLHKNDNVAVCFVDEKLLLWAPPATLKKMIDARKAAQPGTSPIVSQLESDADVAVAIDLKSQSALVGQAAMVNPLLGMLAQINSVSLQVNVTEKAGGKLVELIAYAVNEQTAGALSQLANGGLDQLKAALKAAPTPPDPDQAQQQELVHAIGHSATVKQAGSRIEFLIPVPEGFDKLPEILKPALQQAAKAAANTRKRNNLKQIGLAFHNYHDVYGSFPAAGHAPMKKEGLSWRVHLLPFVDQAPLYNRFAWDEPWDSETNKALIDQMPDIYKTGDVTEAGHTSLHVFTGPGAPFAEDQAPRIASFTDGTSNTILVVNAGAETATIWIKPGGLDFDPENPLRSLGQIGEIFNVLFADGSVRVISDMIDPQTLRRLIQMADGEAVGNF